MAEIETSEVRVAGVRSLVRSAGKASEEAVVFVHGNPGSSEDWLSLLPQVGEFARAIAPDMPGYGQADRPDAFDYTVQGYARHLGSVLEALGVKRAHLVLHDFGGPWGLTWAADHPQQVASLTLLNMGVLRDYRWHKYARIWRTPVLGELFQKLATKSAFRWLLDADNPKPFPREFVDRMWRDMDAGHKRAVLKLYRATSDLAGMSTRLSEKLAGLRLPTLILWGDSDKYLPVRYAHEQTRTFPDAQVHILPGCGHWPFIDEPEQVAARVLPFLRTQLANAAA